MTWHPDKQARQQKISPGDNPLGSHDKPMFLDPTSWSTTELPRKLGSHLLETEWGPARRRPDAPELPDPHANKPESEHGNAD